MEQNLAKHKAFVTAAHTGSITEAARMLHYSQSGVSRMPAVKGVAVQIERHGFFRRDHNGLRSQIVRDDIRRQPDFTAVIDGGFQFVEG